MWEKRGLTFKMTFTGQAPPNDVQRRFHGPVADLHEVDSGVLQPLGSSHRVLDPHPGGAVFLSAQLDPDGEPGPAAFTNPLHHFQAEAVPLAPPILPPVCPRRQELVDQVPMGRMDLHPVETGIPCPQSSVGKGLDDAFYPCLVQGPNRLPEVGTGPGRSAHHRLAGDGLQRLASGMGELRDDGYVGVARPHRLTDPPPGSGLGIGIETALARVHGPPILGHSRETRYDGADPSRGQVAVQPRHLFDAGPPLLIGQPLVGGRPDEPVAQGEGPQVERPEHEGPGVVAAVFAATVAVPHEMLPNSCAAMAATSLRWFSTVPAARGQGGGAGMACGAVPVCGVESPWRKNTPAVPPPAYGADPPRPHLLQPGGNTIRAILGDNEEELVLPGSAEEGCLPGQPRSCGELRDTGGKGHGPEIDLQPSTRGGLVDIPDRVEKAPAGIRAGHAPLPNGLGGPEPQGESGWWVTLGRGHVGPAQRPRDPEGVPTFRNSTRQGTARLDGAQGCADIPPAVGPPHVPADQEAIRRLQRIADASRQLPKEGLTEVGRDADGGKEETRRGPDAQEVAEGRGCHVPADQPGVGVEEEVFLSTEIVDGGCPQIFAEAQNLGVGFMGGIELVRCTGKVRGQRSDEFSFRHVALPGEAQ